MEQATSVGEHQLQRVVVLMRVLVTTTLQQSTTTVLVQSLMSVVFVAVTALLKAHVIVTATFLTH